MDREDAPDIDFKEIQTLSLLTKTYSPGCLTRNDDYLYTLLQKHEIYIYKFHCDWNHIAKQKLRISHVRIKIQDYNPSSTLNANHKAVFNSCSIHESHRLLLNPFMAANHLVHSDGADCFIEAKFSPLGDMMEFDQLLAIATYSGGCVVFKTGEGCTEWKPLKQITVKPSREECKTLNQFQECLDRITFIAIAWNNTFYKSQRHLCCITKSGSLYCYKFERNGKSTLVIEEECKLPVIHRMHWASFNIESSTGKSFLILTHEDGQIDMRQLNFSGGVPKLVKDSDILIWKYKDKLKPLGFNVHYYSVHHSVLITTCKGSFVLVMLIDLNSREVTHKFKRLPEMIS